MADLVFQTLANTLGMGVDRILAKYNKDSLILSMAVWKRKGFRDFMT